MSAGPQMLVLMGVSGSGKTTVGEALSQHLGWRFVDADGFHPPANVEKMRGGSPLNDADRAPWLARLNAVLRHSLAKQEPIIMACSALKADYRRQLADRLPALPIAHLRGSVELIAARLADRQHRYMPASLLQSQFETLEAPADAWDIDIDQPLEAVVAQIAQRLTSAA